MPRGSGIFKAAMARQAKLPLAQNVQDLDQQNRITVFAAYFYRAS
jgi:hypothetical protein